MHAVTAPSVTRAISPHVFTVPNVPHLYTLLYKSLALGAEYLYASFALPLPTDEGIRVRVHRRLPRLVLISATELCHIIIQ